MIFKGIIMILSSVFFLNLNCRHNLFEKTFQSTNLSFVILHLYPYFELIYNLIWINSMYVETDIIYL